MLQTVRECRGHLPLLELYPQGSIPVESSAFFASSEVALFRLPHFCSTILHTLAWFRCTRKQACISRIDLPNFFG